MNGNFQRHYSSPSYSCNTIEASMENVTTVKRRRKKKRKVQSNLRSIAPMLIKSSSSYQSLLKESPQASGLKMLLPAPELTQKQRTPSPPVVENGRLQQFSNSMFSSQASFSLPCSPEFNRIQQIDSASAKTLNDDDDADTYLSECGQRSPMSFKSQLNEEWDDLSQHTTLRNSTEDSLLQQDISQNEYHSQSSYSQVILNQAFESPVHESNFEISPSESESVNGNDVNDVLDSVNEQLRAQNVNQNYLTEQNQNISLQLQNFECYVRGKMDEAEDYWKRKLTQIEESNLAVVNALNDIKRTERYEPIRMDQLPIHRAVDFVMPKIPVSRQISLVLLNSALKDAQYMDQFVSEISHAVTLYVYKPRKTVKSVMTKLFTLNLLIKYTWSDSSGNKPTFSSLTNLLKALAHLLANHMSERDMRREIKEFFQQIPRIYDQQRFRYF